MIPLIETAPVAFGSHKKFLSYLKKQEETKSQKDIMMKDWHVTEDGLKVNGDEYPMRDLAMKQLLRTLEMPLAFYMEKSPTDMTIRDINRMKEEYTSDSEVSVLFQGEEVRGVVDPNFRSVPYPKLIKKLPVAENFKGANYSDWGIRINTADPTDLIKVEKNDIIEVGTDIVASDTGWTGLNGRPYLNRLACTNGVVIKQATDIVSSFRSRYTWRMDEKEWLRDIRRSCLDIVVNCKELAVMFKIMKNESMEKLDGADSYMRRVRGMVTAEVFNEDKELTNEIRDGDKKKCVINLGVSIYVALAQITVLAKTLVFVERRKLETMAGSLVDMTQRAIKMGRIKFGRKK